MRAYSLFVAGLALWASACGTPEATDMAGTAEAAPPLHAADRRQASAQGNNGNFEASGLTGWSSAAYTNFGAAAATPMQFADLHLVAGSVSSTDWAGGPQEGNALAGLDPATSQVRYPRFGAGAAVVNRMGKLRQANSLNTNYVVQPSDLDPVDHQPHLRLVVAPVLQNPNHPANLEAFYYIEVSNHSRNEAVLFSQYRRSGEPEVPWLKDAIDAKTRYTPWQIIDATANPNLLRVGDTLGVRLVAAGCGLGGDFGELYVDALGSTLPAPAISAAAPEYVNDGDILSYDLSISNHGSSQASNVRISVTLPANTTFVTMGHDAALACVPPAGGTPATLTCTAAALAPGAALPLQIAVRVAAGSTGRVVLGNYTIASDASSALLGPMLTTAITHAQPYADLQVTSRSYPAGCVGNQVAFAVTIVNAGPNQAAGASLVDLMPAYVAPLSWSCRATGTAAANGQNPSGGTGPLVATIDLAPGAQLDCVVLANLLAGAQPPLIYSAWATAPAATPDNRASNNSSTFVSRAAYVAAAAPWPLGTACSDGISCSSGICVDGVCCNSRCAGPCYSCAEPGSLGYCEGLSGVAPRPGHPSCGPYLCGAGACLSRCEATAQCASDFVCDHHACVDASIAALSSLNRLCTSSPDCDAGYYCTPRGTCQTPALQPEAAPEWVVLGAGLPALGCSQAGEPSFLLLGTVLATAARAWPRRRRAAAWMAALVAAPMALGAQPRMAQAAQVDKSLPANRFVPLAGAGDVYNVQAASVPAALQLNALAMVHYGNSLVRLVAAQSHRQGLALVRHSGVLDVGVGISFRQRAQLSVAQSLLLQGGQAAPFMAPQLARGPKLFGHSDLRLTGKSVLVHGARGALAITLPITVPTGQKNNFVGYGGITLAPGLAGELQLASGARLLLNAGYAMRPRRVLLDADLHQAVTFGAGAWLPTIVGGEDVAWLATATGEVGLGARRRVAMPVELHVGASWLVRDHLAIDLGAGTGLTNGYGAARWRLQAGIAWAPQRRTARARDAMATVSPLEEDLPALPDNVEPEAALPLPAPPSPTASSSADPAAPSVEPGPAPASAPDASAPIAALAAPTAQVPMPDAYAVAGAHPKLVEPPRRAYAPLAARDIAALEVLVAWLHQVPETQGLAISGYAQGRERRPSTRRRAQRRARAAKAWLMAHGIGADRLDAAPGVARRRLHFVATAVAEPAATP